MTTVAPDREDLRDLIAQIAAQDRAAFALLYRSTSSKLFGAIRRIVGGQEAAEDALQEAFIRVWHSAGGYDATRGRPMTWLIAIARNVAIDHRRHQTASADYVTSDLAEDREDICNDPSPDLTIALHQCLEVMEPVRRDILLKAYIEGWSREELSHHFERTTSTVKSILRRALGFLRSCLAV